MLWLSARRTYLRWRLGPPIVVVSGLPRSGTSMTMKMLAAGGVPLTVDNHRQADEDNPKGYFELERVKHLHEDQDKRWLTQSRGKAIKVISQLLRELPPDHFYRVIFMNRNLDEVLASQNKMLVRRGEAAAQDEAQIRELFERHLWMTRRWLQGQPNFDVLNLEYPEVIAKPEAAAGLINKFLGGGLNVQGMSQVVDGRLYRNRLASDSQG